MEGPPSPVHTARAYTAHDTRATPERTNPRRTTRESSASLVPHPSAIEQAARDIATRVMQRGKALTMREWMGQVRKHLATKATRKTRTLIARRALAHVLTILDTTQDRGRACLRSSATANALEASILPAGGEHTHSSIDTRSAIVTLIAAAIALDLRHGLRLIDLRAGTGLRLAVAAATTPYAIVRLAETATTARGKRNPLEALEDTLWRADTGVAPAPEGIFERCFADTQGEAATALDALAHVQRGGRIVAITAARPAPDAWCTTHPGAPRHTIVASARIGRSTRITVLDRHPPKPGNETATYHCEHPDDGLIAWARSVPSATLAHRSEDETKTETIATHAQEDEAKVANVDTPTQEVRTQEAARTAPTVLIPAPPTIIWSPPPHTPGADHPHTLTEASGLAAAPTPHGTTSQPNRRLDALARRGLLSNAQAYACALAEKRFETALTIGGTKVRAGILIGDGTGTGKSRIAAGVIALTSASKALWITPSARLIEPIGQELATLGIRDTLTLGERQRDEALPSRTCESTKSVCIATWTSLAGSSPEPPGKTARATQVLHWLTRRFDGVIVLDEAHVASTDPRSRTAALMRHLHRALPQARFLYLSGTAAREPGALCTAERLGLWGSPESPWKTQAQCAAELDRAPQILGAATTRWLKTTGALVARDLSLKGVEIAPLAIALTQSDQALFDTYANACAGIEVPPDGRKIWEGARHRAFLALAAALKAPAVARTAREDARNGRAAVIQLVHTEETRLRDAIEGSATHVPGPRETLLQGARTARATPRTLEAIERLPPIAGALDRLVWLIGGRHLAELTARKIRTVRNPKGKLVCEHRNETTIREELDAFRTGKRHVLVFSEAGGTGAQYAAEGPNPRRRVHYVLEPALGALAAVQGLGRTHRAHQSVTPLYRPITAPVLSAERRAAHALGTRLQRLGASTRASEHSYGNAHAALLAGRGTTERLALERLLADAKRERLEGWTCEQLEKRTGLDLDEPIPVARWLNRVMALTIGEQKALEKALEARSDKREDAEPSPHDTRYTTIARETQDDGTTITLLETAQGQLRSLIGGPSRRLKRERHRARIGIDGEDTVLATTAEGREELCAGILVSAAQAVREAPSMREAVDASALWEAIRTANVQVRLGNGWTIRREGHVASLHAPRAARIPSEFGLGRKRRLKGPSDLARLVSRFKLRDVAQAAP